MSDTIELSFDEIGMDVCPECCTLLPHWEWSKRITDCSLCKDRPSQEDIDGVRREWTPHDWTAPR